MPRKSKIDREKIMIYEDQLEEKVEEDIEQVELINERKQSE